MRSLSHRTRHDPEDPDTYGSRPSRAWRTWRSPLDDRLREADVTPTRPSDDKVVHFPW
jgi:hypothetical protein